MAGYKGTTTEEIYGRTGVELEAALTGMSKDQLAAVLLDVLACLYYDSEYGWVSDKEWDADIAADVQSVVTGVKQGVDDVIEKLGERPSTGE